MTTASGASTPIPNSSRIESEEPQQSPQAPQAQAPKPAAPPLSKLLVPQCGYCTVESRLEYIRMMKKNTSSSSSEQQEQVQQQIEPSSSMVANLDIHQPLYFWQLYSLLGREPIYEILTYFYQRIYSDENPETDWFREAFTANDSISSTITATTTTTSNETTTSTSRNNVLQGHILSHAAYWIDAMGGGPIFHGGEYRLSFHHKYHASRIMTAQGATQWMNHMKDALRQYCQQNYVLFNNNNCHSSSFTTTVEECQQIRRRQRIIDDPRVIPCILEFLKTKMTKYANQYGWKLQECDFDWEEVKEVKEVKEDETKTKKEDEKIHQEEEYEDEDSS